jgi:hypothetical protein
MEHTASPASVTNRFGGLHNAVREATRISRTICVVEVMVALRARRLTVVCSMTILAGIRGDARQLRAECIDEQTQNPDRSNRREPGPRA